MKLLRCAAVDRSGRRCCLFESHVGIGHLVAADPDAPSDEVLRRVARSFGATDDIEDGAVRLAREQGMGIDEFIVCCDAYMVAMLTVYTHLRPGALGAPGATKEERLDALPQPWRRTTTRPRATLVS
jgi:hypothetical protein